MTDNPHLFEAKKDGLRQTQDGLWKLTLTVLPHDMPAWLLSAPMGQLIGASGLHEIHDHADDMASMGAKPISTLPKDAQHCAALCDKDVAWRKFIRALADARCCFPGTLVPGDGWHSYMDDGHDPCVERVYEILGITSRARINDDPAVNAKWHELLTAFRTTTGRDTEVRR